VVQEGPQQHLACVGVDVLGLGDPRPGEVQLGQGALGEVVGEVPVAAHQEGRVPQPDDGGGGIGGEVGVGGTALTTGVVRAVGASQSHAD